MNGVTLNDSTFCSLVKRLQADKVVTHIKVKGHGDSMTPFIKNDEILFIRPVHLKAMIRVGDIVAVTDQIREKIIVHRVIRRKKNLFQIKGDNCIKNDGWFQKNKILGLLTKKIKKSGKIYTFKRWENILVAFFSRTGILNSILLPFGRVFKNKLQTYKK